MKKIKVIATVIILAILLILISLALFENKAESYSNSGETKLDSLDSRWGSEVKYVYMTADNVLYSNNIYCVEKGQVVSEGRTEWVVRSKAEIKGNNVRFYMLLKNQGWVDYGAGNSGAHNNKLGAILCEGELGRYTSSKEATDSQEALWSYWNTWVDLSGATGVKMYKCGTNTGEYDSKYDQYSNSYSYNVTVYFLEARPDTNSGYQNLILVERGPKDLIKPIDITVIKRWINDTEADRPANGIVFDLWDSKGNRVKSIRLPEEGTVNGNEWTGTFSDLSPSETYTVSERDEGTLNAYEKNVNQNNNTWIFTNTLKNTSVTVNKVWKDDENRDGKRPSSITVRLYENGNSTNTTAILKSPEWTWTFYDLPKYKNGNLVEYTVKEETVPEGYTSTINEGTITNTHIPEEIEIKTTKKWKDDYKDIEDFDEIRPDSIIVKLLADGIDTGLRVTLSENNNWTDTFKSTTSNKIYKYKRAGKLIKYTTQEIAYTKDGTQYTIDASGIPGYGAGTIGTNDNEYTITNTHTLHYDGYIEVSGKVWLDKPDGKGNDLNGVLDTDGDSKDERLKNVKVRLCDKNGNSIKSTYTDENGEFTRNDYAKTDENGEYTIRVNYDNSQNVYKLYEDINTVNEKMKTAYVEFEYDGMKYTTVAKADTGDNTSKAKEDEETRNTFDRNHTTVTSATTKPESWTDKNIIAITNTVTSYESKDENKEVTIKYCNGNGEYIRTNPDGAWKNILPGTNNLACNSGKGHDLGTYGITVQKIPNINLGLFEREQPDVAIFSDLTKVEVEMNEQKYTYLYGVKGDESNKVGLQAKFQNKGTYTYRRPVNPADIAYIQEEAHKNAMSVKVTYEVKLANLSTTLPITVHNITNYFDKEYTLNTSEWTVIKGTEFNKATYNGDLNITVKPQSESSAIELTYTVNMEAIRKLLNEDATLNNAVEIESFGAVYGATTLYAEQRTGGRTNQPYAGYDYNSHPGNSNIKLMYGEDGVKRLYSTDTNGNRISTDQLEDDTDIAPSFVLCKDAPTAVSGIVWEDSKNDRYAKVDKEKERLGDGWRSDEENEVENVKIELYEVDKAGNIGTEPATLYTIDSTGKAKTTLASKNTNSHGKYTFEGLITGKEYLIKYTYGNGTTINVKNSTIKNDVNARNYKSTIITDEDKNVKDILEKDYSSFTDKEKMWPITHNERYSVAVDNMEDRLKIGVLKNSTYDIVENMTAYTKPFIIPLEFDLTLRTIGNADKDGNVNDLNGGAVVNELNKFDFGIIERPREELIVQKTISYFKITLANGQLLIEGNPNDPNANISYTKAIGFKESTSVEEARRALEKRLLVEIDSELIQGAKLEVTYAVRIINNNEIDYEYGKLDDYTNGHIAKGKQASYYYYGEKTIQEEMKSTIKFVDYLDTKLVYEEDTKQWKQANSVELNEKGFINEEVKNELSKGKYIILQNEINEPGGSPITIPRGISTTPIYMTTSKLLANRDDNTFYNHAEIIEIDGKTGRTIKGKYEDGTQIKYMPGNYNPSAGPNESDDDSVNITITPPTGITNYTITYVIAGLVGLIIIFVAIVFIKKKVLNN